MNTYILFGSTNPYLAQRSGWKDTIVAFRSEYEHLWFVQSLMQHHCVGKSDNYIIDEHDNVVDCNGNIVLDKDALAYEHDGRFYEFVPIDDLTEQQARVALRDNVLFDEHDKQTIYAMYPDLAPVPVEDEE